MRVPKHQGKSYAWRWTAALAGLAVLAFALVMAVAVRPASKVQGAGATYTVDNSGDATGGISPCQSGVAGDCSLRQAIEQANANSGAANTINFGSGITTITPGSAYQPLADLGLTISGGGQTIAGAFAALVVNANSVTITGLTLDGNGLALVGVTVNPSMGYTHLTNVEVRNYSAIGGVGIKGLGNNDYLVLDTVHVDYNGVGIQMWSNSNNNTIGSSNIDHNITGIDLPGTPTPGSGNRILNNYIHDNYSIGIGTFDQSGLSIVDNTITANAAHQIVISGPSTGVVTIKNNSIDVGSGDGIALDTQCACGGVQISGTTDVEANCFSGNLAADQYYLINVSGTSVHAEHNYWAGDTNPVDKICASNQTNVNCDTGAMPPPPGSDVIVRPVALSCGVSATPTATPVPGATSTRTPVPGSPTAIMESPMESVALVVGCNPETSSYADATPIATLAGAVSPTGILVSIWQFDAGTSTWLGYSAQAPQASNLASVDRISVVFICVSAAGTWSRPII